MGAFLSSFDSCVCRLWDGRAARTNAADCRQSQSRQSRQSRSGTPSLREQHAFLDAAKKYNFGRVRRLVLECPALVNAQPGGRWSALHQFAENDNAVAVQFLLSHGAVATLRTRDGLTPLGVAGPSTFELILAASPMGTDGRGNQSVSHTSDEAFQGMPVWKFGRDGSAVHGQSQCRICLEDFAEGDELRTMPCSHSFHKGCVDQWLKDKSNSCPTCRIEIV